MVTPGETISKTNSPCGEKQDPIREGSAYTVPDRWGDIGSLFALDDPDVRQNVPRDMQGPAVKAYFEQRAKAPPTEGVMHQHAFLSPIVEIAGDGRTAKGVWDSTGADVGNGEGTANLAWVRYGVDFIKTPQGWKIWHLRVASVWRVPYGGNWQEAVKAAASAPPGGRWRYNGKGQVPLDPALPKPYYAFDPKDAY